MLNPTDAKGRVEPLVVLCHWSLALAGCDDPPAQKPQRQTSGALTIELPEPVTEPSRAAPSAEEKAIEPKPAPAEERPTPAAEEKSKLEAAAQETSSPSTAAEPTPTTPPEAAPEEGADATPAASTQTARPPLPNRVMARTLDRIGFRCGSVTSSVRLEGDEPSAFQITCSSGQSYRASNRTGRYRFSKWGETD
jgi:outer membrane biosynthesis protein TonB